MFFCSTSLGYSKCEGYGLDWQSNPSTTIPQSLKEDLQSKSKSKIERILDFFNHPIQSFFLCLVCTLIKYPLWQKFPIGSAEVISLWNHKHCNFLKFADLQKVSWMLRCQSFLGYRLLRPQLDHSDTCRLLPQLPGEAWRMPIGLLQFALSNFLSKCITGEMKILRQEEKHL